MVDKKLLARLTFLEQEEELINLQEQRNVQAKKKAETEANIESLKKNSGNIWRNSTRILCRN